MRMRSTPATSILRLLHGLLALALATAAFAARAADEFLDPDKAFQVSVRPADDRTLELTFQAAPGYYLYREQFRFVADGATLGPATLPQGRVKFDETFRKNVETYRGTLRVTLPVEAAGGSFRLYTQHQGCADAGLCYPPQPKGFRVSLAGFGGDGSVRALADSEVPQTLPGPGGAADALSGGAGGAAATAPPLAAGAEASALGSALQDGRFWPVVGAFFLAGILLSFTPCVLPMLPIVSSIIAGHGGTVSRGRGFALAAAYSFGMAVVYTALGVAAGLAGEGLAAAFQKPWVLALFAAGLVALALSMFGVYELRLPSAFTNRMADVSTRLPAGRVAGVLAMGGVSALIVSPCVAAPLAGALVYLSQTHDVWLGGTALFSLAGGMSVPLLLVGASAGALLPRAGPWMNEVKAFFGLLLLGVALYTVQIVLPAGLVLALWGVLFIAGALLLASPARRAAAAGAAARNLSSSTSVGAAAASGGAAAGVLATTSTPAARPAPRPLWRRAAAAVLAVVGIAQLVGAASGGTDPLQPLAPFAAGRRAEAAGAGMPVFVPVVSIEALDATLRTAGRPVVLDFYADWCVSCKEMERYTYTDPAVQAKLGRALLLKADVTRNNPDDRALLKRFGLFGPPGTIFFDAQGKEVAAARTIGYQRTERFLETLRAAGL